MNPIIPFDEHYHDTLVDIWHRAVRATHHFLTEEDIQYYYDIVANGALRGVELAIALSHEPNDLQKPIGFIGLEGNKIEMLFVDPHYMGKGVGTQLVQYAQTLKGHALAVDVNEQNEAAYCFYTHYGFKQINRSELDGSGKPFPLLHLAIAE